MNKKKAIFCFFLFFISFYYMSITIKIDIVDLVKNSENKIGWVKEYKDSFLDNPVNLLNVSNKEISKNKVEKTHVIEKSNKDKAPIIYFFNTHQKEEYGKNAYNITPTVVTASHILEDELKEKGISSFVETKDIIAETKRRNLDYVGTYEVSFDFLKMRKEEYNSLEYFFDIHRDSVTGEAARIKIKGKNYASTMFLVGANFDTYNKNLENVHKMENYLNKKYPGLMRNTYIQKNSSFNQYYSPNMFLVEIGGPDNTLEEVYNSCAAIADAISYYVEG